jgi:acyl-coenzyme A thioesterase PaaI-like protein
MTTGSGPPEPFRDDRHCLCCGEKNPVGLNMTFRYEGDRLLSEAVVPKHYQGFADIVHGGILGTLLDEVMVNLHWLRGVRAVSVEYTVRLKAPCPTGRKVMLAAWEMGTRKRLHLTASEARLEDGTLVAEATSKCLEV